MCKGLPILSCVLSHNFLLNSHSEKRCVSISSTHSHSIHDSGASFPQLLILSKVCSQFHLSLRNATTIFATICLLSMCPPLFSSKSDICSGRFSSHPCPSTVQNYSPLVLCIAVSCFLFLRWPSNPSSPCFSSGYP